MKLLALLLAVTACQGQNQGTTGSGAGTGSGSAPVPTPSDSGFGSIPDDAEPAPAPQDARAKLEEPEPPDPGKRIAELGAIPAWQAVIDRAQYLGRRKQRGVVYGRVGPAIMEPGPAPTAPADAGVPVDAGVVASPYVWLVDDTEGNGTLGIRVLLEGRAKEGDRVALGGAWELDDKRTWFWRVDKVEPLPPGPTTDLKDPPAAVPSHAIVNGDLPQGARTITVAKDNDAVYFQIVGPSPITEGDGWPVANELGDTTYALLSLPGERPSYGGQDMRSPDERWQLKKGQTYWVRIGKIRKRGPDQPVLINARTAPVRVN
ncbi:MAG: hypothetical protein SFX73_36320 [Kofleriaceae bacterium]|nr:hypothetical protein [Kofleriaceae bacterium]